MLKHLLLLAILVCFTWQSYAQTKPKTPQPNSAEQEAARDLIQKNATQLGLKPEETSLLQITSTYQDAISKATMVYAQQTYQQIPVYNVIYVMAFKNGKLFSVTGNKKLFYPKDQKNLRTAGISAAEAVKKAVAHLNLTIKELPNARQSADTSDVATHFGNLGIAQQDIEAKQIWVPQQRGPMRLAWQVEIKPLQSSDHWLVRVDALTGEVLGKDNYTVYCAWDGQLHDESCHNIAATQPNAPELYITAPLANATYRVAPFPFESIVHAGNASLVSNPWELAGSGNNATTWQWQSDGSQEFAITRGNNVFAMEDWDNNNNIGFSPSMTAPGTFDYTSVPGEMPSKPNSSSQNAGIVNLFYWTNLAHDLSYQYGFDEASGNFQFNNADRGGAGRDLVIAQAQDGSGVNNANFSSPPDGFVPFLQTYLFTDNSKLLAINAPASIAGNMYALNAEATVTPPASIAQQITADLIYYAPNKGCLAISDETLAGKIVMIDRGDCSFSTKIFNAQEAGAVGVVIANTNTVLTGIGGEADNITIPAVMVSFADANKLKNALNTGNVNLTLGASEAFRDGSFDNGVIVHEYAHGISNRLTGGPAIATCLQNAEQPGEGWSDYYALMTTTNWTTAQPDQGTMARTVGTFAFNGTTSGAGARIYPYSTDMNINPWTYGKMVQTGGVVHSIGEIWAATLWDMTWAMIQQDGVINANIFDATAPGGNSAAMLLVTQAMKLQPCSPGFLDARDAILKADTLLFDSKYSCTIWQSFARRGMGFKASQGSSYLYNDQIEDFSMPTATIYKVASAESVQADGLINFTITVRNFSCSDFSGEVLEVLPESVTHVSGGVYDPGHSIHFRGINLAKGESVSLTYQVRADRAAMMGEDVHLNETVDIPTIPADFVTYSTTPGNWEVSDTRSHSPGRSFYAHNAGVKEDKYLTVNGNYPVTEGTILSFWHYYDTEEGWDGGVVEISINGSEWNDVPSALYIRNGYNNAISETDSPLSGRSAFTGYSGGFIQSIIDLSPFAQKNIRIRFRFASDISFAVDGWYVDDIRLATQSFIRSEALLFENTTAIGWAATFTPVLCPGLLATDNQVATVNLAGQAARTLRPSEDNCAIIATVKPDSKTSSVTGLVSAKVWVSETQPREYLKRHFEITPANNAATATGKVTLYFSQEEFNDFNAQIPAPSLLLPTSPEDPENYKANLKIEKRAGSGSGDGTPGSYPDGNAVTVVPSEANGKVEWNADYSRWEVSFDVTGFSGFFVKTTPVPLPLNLIRFTATRESGLNRLHWNTTNEVNTKAFEIQRSVDARNFVRIGDVPAKNEGNHAYSFDDTRPYQGEVYYRLKMLDTDGKFAYSRIIGLDEGNVAQLPAYPNPTTETIHIDLSPQLVNTTAELVDAGGKSIRKINVRSRQQRIGVKDLPTGLYLIKFTDGSTARFIKK